MVEGASIYCLQDTAGKSKVKLLLSRIFRLALVAISRLKTSIYLCEATRWIGVVLLQAVLFSIRICLLVAAIIYGVFGFQVAEFSSDWF